MIILGTEETHDNLTVIWIAAEFRTLKSPVVTVRIDIIYLKINWYNIP
jgi:hypothetical protein